MHASRVDFCSVSPDVVRCIQNTALCLPKSRFYMKPTAVVVVQLHTAVVESLSTRVAVQLRPAFVCLILRRSPYMHPSPYLPLVKEYFELRELRPRRVGGASALAAKARTARADSR